MSVVGVVRWDILQEIAPIKTLNRQRHWGDCTIHWKQTPISRSLLNEFFTKLIQSERKQEIAKAKLKKARQQLGAQINPTQAQVGGGNVPIPPTKVTPALTVPPVVTPPPANAPRKAQVGRPARVTKPKPLPLAMATGPKKAPQPKPPVTRSKAKNQPTPASVVVTDPESDTAAPVDPEYDTDELAELPMILNQRQQSLNRGKKMLKLRSNDN